MKNPITSLREAIDLTQAEFAKRLGRTQSTVSRWESGEQTPDGAALKDLQRLGLNVGAFLAWAPADKVALAVLANNGVYATLDALYATQRPDQQKAA